MTSSIIKRNMTRGGDAEKLDYIQKGLSRLKIPIYAIREREIEDEGFLNGGHVPDLILNKHIILEHDTQKIHGELGFEDGKTLRRNADYIITKRPFFVINQDLARHCKLDEIGLSEYLYYHTLMIEKAIKESLSRSQH